MAGLKENTSSCCLPQHCFTPVLVLWLVMACFNCGSNSCLFPPSYMTLANSLYLSGTQCFSVSWG